jgi:hypothetical protein
MYTSYSTPYIACIHNSNAPSMYMGQPPRDACRRLYAPRLSSQDVHDILPLFITETKGHFLEASSIKTMPSFCCCLNEPIAGVPYKLSSTHGWGVPTVRSGRHTVRGLPTPLVTQSPCCSSRMAHQDFLGIKDPPGRILDRAVGLYHLRSELNTEPGYR